jgi:uncharacterized protein YjbI with pentapeptide repeats
MANREHLDILKQGVETWNEWREEHPDIRPDLWSADFRDAHLFEADLRNADLSEADLSKADLRRANLRGVDLHEANLSGAYLREANLSRSDLKGADLSNADLHGANLSRTDLGNADLSNADLHGANLSGTDLSNADLSNADLHGANLEWAQMQGTHLRKANLSEANLNNSRITSADLSEANLSEANLSDAQLQGANLTRANLRKAHLSEANLTQANLTRADLSEANLSGADLSEANLSGADLGRAILVQTKLHKATLTNCRVYGISVWDVDLTEAEQFSLIITNRFSREPNITVDNLKVAQFIYLLLNNQEIREVIHTIGQKGVLILGRFSQERKLVLDALRAKLRTLNFLPIVFDFESPTGRDFTETIMTLAGLSCFIIADITNPRSTPLELQATIPNYMIPFVPILQEGEQPFSMFQDLRDKYDWVLDTLVYDTPSRLIQGLEKAIVKPALEKRDELMPKKMEKLRMRHIGDYL